MEISPWQRTIRIGAGIAAALFIAALAAHDLQFDRELDLRVDTIRNHANRYLSPVGPGARVTLGEDGIHVVGEPVYVTARLPRWFDAVDVEVTYAYDPTSISGPIQLGPRTNPTAWQYQLVQFPDPTGMEPPVGVRSSGAPLHRVRIPFALDRRWQVERNAYQFLLSVPGVSVDHPFVIHALRVIATRDPICFGGFCV